MCECEVKTTASERRIGQTLAPQETLKMSYESNKSNGRTENFTACDSMSQLYPAEIRFEGNSKKVWTLGILAQKLLCLAVGVDSSKMYSY